MFLFSLQLLSETFLILRRIQRDIIKMYIGSLYFCQISRNLAFSREIFEKILRYQITLKSVQWQSSHSMRTDGHTDV